MQFAPADAAKRNAACADAPLAEGEESAEPGSLAVDTVELLSAVLAQSPSNRRSMQQISGAHPNIAPATWRNVLRSISAFCQPLLPQVKSYALPLV